MVRNHCRTTGRRSCVLVIVDSCRHHRVLLPGQHHAGGWIATQGLPPKRLFLGPQRQEIFAITLLGCHVAYANFLLDFFIFYRFVCLPFVSSFGVRPYVFLSVHPIKCVYISLMCVCMSVTFLISNFLLLTSYF